MQRALLTAFMFLILLIISAPATVNAADYGGKIRKANYVAAKAGIYFPTSDLNDLGFDSGFNGELAIGHHFGERVAVEFGVGYFRSDGEASGVTRDIAVVPVTLTAKYVIPLQVGEAYAGAGGGVYHARLEQRLGPVTTRDEDTVVGGHVMAGADFDLTDNMFAGVEAKWIVTDDANFFGREVALGGAMLTGNFGVRF